MATLEILEKLYKQGRISEQAYKTYKGQVKHGAETACIIGMQRKHLINDKGEIIDGKKDIITRAGR